MGSATIKVEFIAGSTIEDSFSEAIRIAKLLSCWIEFNFNGVTCMANSDGTVGIGCMAYHRELKSNGRNRIAFSS